MKIIVVGMMKNEQAFVESAVRYWLTFADQVILYDHGSTDGTPDILRALKEELDDRLVLYNESYQLSFAKRQANVTNAMIATAMYAYGADLVLPLDADEFPLLGDGETGTLREFLESLPQDRTYMTYWVPFAPTPGKPTDLNTFAPLAFTRRKRVQMPRWGKVMLTRSCYETHELLILAGNHGFVRQKGKSLPPQETLTPKMFYAHYPCCGKEHYLVKNMHGWLACYADRAWIPGNSIHYQRACEKILQEAVSDELVEWYCMTSAGLTGETLQDMETLVEEMDPREMYPRIDLRYTAQYAKIKEPVIRVYESALSVVELLRESYAREDKLAAENARQMKAWEAEKACLVKELEAIKASKAYKLGTLAAASVRRLYKLFKPKG